MKPTFFTSVTYILLVSSFSLLSTSLTLFPYSYPLLSSLAYFTCLVTTLSLLYPPITVRLKLVFRVILITQLVISKSIGWSVDSAKPVGCHQATIFSNVKSMARKDMEWYGILTLAPIPGYGMGSRYEIPYH